MEADLVRTGAMIGAAIACFLVVAVPASIVFFGFRFLRNRGNSDGGDE
ncbi:MAG: hypothetical protein ACI861_002129 [Paracoccaceae bacterium]|jgi:hypothetical protein